MQNHCYKANHSVSTIIRITNILYIRKYTMSTVEYMEALWKGNCHKHLQ